MPNADARSAGEEDFGVVDAGVGGVRSDLPAAHLSVGSDCHVVTRDGVKQSGVRVMINYSNDVLVDDKSTDQRRLYLVQHWNQVAQYSTGPLKCIEFLACMTDAEHATGEKLTPGARGTRTPFVGVTMTNKQVQFLDESGALVSIALR